MATKNNPGAFDCYENAAPDEPMFVLLGRDPVAGLLVLAWIELRAQLGQAREDEQLKEAEQCAVAMGRYAENHGKSAQLSELWSILKESGWRNEESPLRMIAEFLNGPSSDDPPPAA